MRDDTLSPETGTLGRLRALLLAVLAIGLTGTAVDLFLLEHYEDLWQSPPLVAVALGLLAVAWVWRAGSAAAVKALRAVMVLCLLTGAAGLAWHYQGNVEFQREMDPSLSGWPLVLKVLRAKAPPALAPAAMIQIGLVGLLYTYRHGALAARRAPSHERERAS
jgi:hypothetical protein